MAEFLKYNCTHGKITIVVNNNNDNTDRFDLYQEFDISRYLNVANYVHASFNPDCKCHGEHVAGAARHEVPVHANVLLQELPEHRQDQQLHQLPELFPPEGAS